MLFQPFVFKRGIKLRNSVAMAPMTTWSSNNDLTISDEKARYYEARVGLVITDYEFCTAYTTAKFGLEGWMRLLKSEVAPFGIHTMLVNPAFFRTEFLTDNSTYYDDEHTAAYAAHCARQIQGWQGANGHQPGDPTATMVAASGSALPWPQGWFSAGSHAAVRRPSHTMSELKTPVLDSMASAIARIFIKTSSS